MKEQGKDIPVQGAEVVTDKRMPSKSGTIKGLKTTIKNVEVLKMATPEELEILKKVYKDVTERWIGLEMEL